MIRPWKSRLGLFYIRKKNFILDIKLIFITIISLFLRRRSLKMVSNVLKLNGAPIDLIKIALRDDPLYPTPPPGSDTIIRTRDI